MRKILVRVLIGIAATLLGGYLVLSVLSVFGLVSVGISPLHNYRLTAEEAARLDTTHVDVHAKMADEQFDSILEDLVEAGVRKEENIRNMRKARETFGVPRSFEFFRSSNPEPASTYYPNQPGTNYITFYFTKGDKAEFHEWIDWIVDDAGRARIRSYSATEIVEWQTKNRLREKQLDRDLPNEIRIPIFGYFVEIRY